jgi:hypothetical protein
VSGWSVRPVERVVLLPAGREQGPEASPWAHPGGTVVWSRHATSLDDVRDAEGVSYCRGLSP